jgi:hypothetical protein
MWQSMGDKMITYKIALIPTIAFGLGQITNGIKEMFYVGIFVFIFIMVCLLLNNFICNIRR